MGLDTPFFSKLRTNFINDFIVDNRFTWLLSGLGTTIVITIFSTLLGLTLGLTLAIIKVLDYNGKRIFFVTRLAEYYLTIIRGTPVVVQLLIIYYVIFGSINISKVLVAVLAFGINSGAYVAEIIRAGILAVDRGQMEAGRSLGLTYGVTMQKIILPQAFKNVLPALFNELITLLKETAVAGYIAIADLARAGDMIRARTFDAFLPLFAVAGIYLVLVVCLTQLMGKLERRLRRSDNR
ncbi:MAG: amino acid ABC transporter permease [Eubacteriales bacterium]|nr:amino acid ABC transporter permease [Eubacteriales bacterium]MDD3198036.1 amino acid ABC transporter permease [Eubacteriales bacterium]MDD3502491.1 amino acid ABC transporter permease [Eubacteriales bacterium]MDD4683179.1 amino acid ABC transporter permease [Eubacteriales bacterium]